MIIASALSIVASFLLKLTKLLLTASEYLTSLVILNE